MFHPKGTAQCSPTQLSRGPKAVSLSEVREMLRPPVAPRHTSEGPYKREIFSLFGVREKLPSPVVSGLAHESPFPGKAVLMR